MAEAVGQLMKMKKFTAEPMLTVIRRLAGEGKTSKEIAMLVGSTSGSIRTICSHNKIGLVATGAVRGRRMIGVSMPNSIYEIYGEQAKMYSIVPARMMSAILTIVARDDLFAAVIDELEDANKDLLRSRPRRYRKKAASVSQVPRDTGNGAAADHERPPHPSKGDPVDLV